MTTEPGRHRRAISPTLQIVLIVAFATILAVLAFAAASSV